VGIDMILAQRRRRGRAYPRLSGSSCSSGGIVKFRHGRKTVKGVVLLHWSNASRLGDGLFRRVFPCGMCDSLTEHGAPEVLRGLFDHAVSVTI